MYSDNENKTCILLNKKAPLWSTLNGAFHASLALSGHCRTKLDMQRYINSENRVTQCSRYPVIVFRGRHQDLKRSYTDAVDSGLIATYFIDSMVAESLEVQQQATALSTFDSSVLLAVAMFGSAEALLPLTKRLSLLGNSWQ